MRMETAPEQMWHDLHRLFNNIRSDLDRIEILPAALNALDRPVPDYEPGFQHLQHAILSKHELG